MTIKSLNIKNKKNNTTLNNSHTSQYERIFQHSIFDLPFRSFFLLAPAFAIISLALWLSILNGIFSFNTGGLTPNIWHIHEMIFAFGATVAIAFIMTAAQTWTGQRSLNGKPLARLILLWLACRLAFYINTEVSIYAAIFLQSIWWLLVISQFTTLVLKAKNRRNYIFTIMMLLMAMLNIAILVSDISGNTGVALHLSRSMILVFILLMAIVGGRVIPFFTVKGAKTPSISTPKWLDLLLIPVSVIGLIIFILSDFVNLPLKPASFMIAASILHFIRLLHWRTLQTLSVPLLWSLHIAYAFVSIGLLALGLSYYQIGISFSDSLHLITIGAISLMILSMMSRVSLGHTGRLLVVKNIISFAFIAMLVAALIRSFLPYLLPKALVALPLLSSVITNPIIMSWNLSAGLWACSMLIFIICYWHILTTNKR